jgi:ferredoxin
MEKIRQVDAPTTRIVGEVERFDGRETGFRRAARGDYGPVAEAAMGGRRSASNPMNTAITSTFSGYPPRNESASSLMERAGLHRGYLPQDVGVLSRHIKSLGHFMGADVMGICKVPPYAFYKCDGYGRPVECKHEYAIAIVVDQGYRTMNASNGRDWVSSTQSMRAYSLSAFISVIIANYVRQLGYAAQANHFRYYEVVVPPLLMLAGIGEIARNGIVLNPFLGLRFKAAVVTTDMPLAPDKPVDFGLQDFCKKCKKCAVECPAQAISYDDRKIVYNGYERYSFSAERCTRFRVTNPNGSMCGRCMKVCPWNKPKGWMHDMVRWMIQNTPFMNSAVTKMDDVFGYGKAVDDEKWWFDFGKAVQGGR